MTDVAVADVVVGVRGVEDVVGKDVVRSSPVRVSRTIVVGRPRLGSMVISATMVSPKLYAGRSAGTTQRADLNERPTRRW